MVNWWFGGWWFGILGIPLSNNPFRKTILGIQTTGPPNQQLTTSWKSDFRKKTLKVQVKDNECETYFNQLACQHVTDKQRSVQNKKQPKPPCKLACFIMVIKLKTTTTTNIQQPNTGSSNRHLRKPTRNCPQKIQRAFTSFRLRDINRAIVGAAWLPAPSIRGLEDHWLKHICFKTHLFSFRYPSWWVFWSTGWKVQKNEHEWNFEG